MNTQATLINVIVLGALIILSSTRAYADWFYTTDPKGELTSGKYHAEGFEGYVSKSPQPGLIPIYRFFNGSCELHFYTTDINGEGAPGYARDADAPAFYCSSTAQRDTSPLYRWYSPHDDGHFYTTAKDGELAPSLSFKPEGILCHVFSSEGTDRTKLFRWFKGKGTTAPRPAEKCEFVCENPPPQYPTEGQKCQNKCTRSHL